MVLTVNGRVTDPGLPYGFRSQNVPVKRQPGTHRVTPKSSHQWVSNHGSGAFSFLAMTSDGKALRPETGPVRD